MDNTENSAYDDQSRNLGQTLIQWIKRVNAKKIRKNNAADDSAKNKKSTVSVYQDMMMSISFSGSEGADSRKAGFYP
jgi:hypothetical protein